MSLPDGNGVADSGADVITLIRLAPAFKAIGVGRSRGYELMHEGLLPRAIKISDRAAAIPSNELEAVIAARVGGASPKVIRALVRRLHAERATIAAAALDGSVIGNRVRATRT